MRSILITICGFFCLSVCVAGGAANKAKTKVKASEKLACCSCKKSKSCKDKKAPPSAWEGSNASLGIIVNTGNTDTSNVNTGVVIKYKRRRWSDHFQGSAQFGRDSGAVTKEQYFAQNQMNYRFSDSFKQFIYANGNITVDRFSPYNYQSVFSMGYGRDLVEGKAFKLSVQAGPGFRLSEDRDDGESHRNLVLSTQLDASWQITKNGQLTEALTYNVGSPFNYLKSVTAFINKITKNIALQISFAVAHYSSIPPGSTLTKKTDTTTSISVVYNF